MSPLRIRLIAVIAVGILVPAAAMADSEAPEVAARPLMAVDEPEFGVFAEIWRQVVEIRQRYGERMQGASPDERQVLWTDANREMRAVVERSTLSPQRYNLLAATAAADPGLKSRLAAHLEQISVSPQSQ